MDVSILPQKALFSVHKRYGLGFKHLPRDLANVNAWKTMFDPYVANIKPSTVSAKHTVLLN